MQNCPIGSVLDKSGHRHKLRRNNRSSICNFFKAKRSQRKIIKIKLLSVQFPRSNIYGHLSEYHIISFAIFICMKLAKQPNIRQRNNVQEIINCARSTLRSCGKI